MASGWAKDGAVQEQIDASIEDGVKHSRSRLPQGESPEACELCEEPIPEARRKAMPGTRLCVVCQGDVDRRTPRFGPGYNRRGSKDSQLR